MLMECTGIKTIIFLSPVLLDVGYRIQRHNKQDPNSIFHLIVRYSCCIDGNASIRMVQEVQNHSMMHK
jgi:hypothetical protein